MSIDVHEVVALLTILEKAHVGPIRIAAQNRLNEIEESLKPEPEEGAQPTVELDNSHNPTPARRESVEQKPEEELEPKRLDGETDEEYEARVEEWRQANE